MSTRRAEQHTPWSLEVAEAPEEAITWGFLEGPGAVYIAVGMMGTIFVIEIMWLGSTSFVCGLSV